MGYTILGGFDNPSRGRQARNLTTNVPKILDLKSSSEQIFSKNRRWVPLFSFRSKPSQNLMTSKAGLLKKKARFAIIRPQKLPIAKMAFRLVAKFVSKL